MLNLEIKEKCNFEDEPIKLFVDFNRYQILIIAKEDWQLILDKNFMKMLGLTKYVIKKDIIDLKNYLKLIKRNI